MDKWIEVKHIMTTDLITADPDETIDAVRHKLIANHIQHIPVVEDKKIIGIISKGVAKVKVEDLGRSLPSTLP